MDFYEVMKSYGIERRVAKAIALHFSGKGLENQGSRAYSKLHVEKLAASNSLQESPDQQANRVQVQHGPSASNSKQDSPEHHTNGDQVLHGHSERQQKPKVSAERSQPESKWCNQAEGGEDWESEVAKAAPRKNFTLKCTIPTPLSLNVDDFSSAQSGKTKGKLSPREKRENPSSCSSSKVAHSRSEGHENRNAEVDGKKPCTKATEVEVREKTSRPKSKVSTHPREKKVGRLNKPVKDSKWEGKAKKEAVVSTKGSKKDFIEEKTPKSTETPQKRSSDKETEQCGNNISPNEQESSNKIELQFQRSPCDQSPSFGIDSLSAIDKKLQPSVIPSLDDDLSTEEVKQKFASIFVGDIAILVPVENSGGCDSNENELHETGSNNEDQTAVADFNRGITAFPVTLVQMETTTQSDNNATPPQSTQKTLNTCLQDQPKNDSIPECKKMVDTEEGDDEKLMENALLSSGNKDSHSQMESSLRTTGSNSLKDNNEKIAFCSDNSNIYVKNISKDSEAVVVMDKTSHQEKTPDLGVTVVTVQDPVLAEKNESSHSASVMGEGDNISIPWQELQLTPHASLPEHALDQPACGRFVMSEGLACQDMNTDDVDNSRHDLQAELSSESSSTSGESMDAFSRQPPLGAERGFTPDTVYLQPDQTAWVGNMNERMYPTPSIPGVNYPQGSFPSYFNPYGTFHQAQQALPLLKPYFTPFGYPNQMRAIVPPHMLQPHSQVFMPPYLQYRNQMMFSSAVPPVAGFPSATMPPLQYRPQMYQVWQGSTGFTCHSVPFYGNPYEQAQETTGAMLDVESTQPQTTLSLVTPAVEYSMMDFSHSPVGDAKEESGSELSSTASRDSPFEVIKAPASSCFYTLCDHSTLNNETLSAQLEDDPGFTMLVTNEGKQNDTVLLKENDVLTGKVSENRNVDVVFSLAQLCHNEVSENGIDHLNKTTDTCYLDSSKGYFSQPLSQDQGDPVHKQITILSREESAVAMEKRLSPDGSCMDAVSFDSLSDASSAQKIDRPVQEKSSSGTTWQDPSKDNNGYRPRYVPWKDRNPFPKPQRFKGSRNRRKKPTGTQPSSVVVSSSNHEQPSNGVSSDIVPVSSPDLIRESALSLDNHNSSKNNKTEHSQRTVRFSNEHTEYDSTNRKPHGGKKVSSADKNDRSDNSRDQKVNDKETYQTCVIDIGLTKSLSVEDHNAGRLYEGRSQTHAEKRTVVDSKPAHVRGNSNKRVNNRMTRKPYTEKRSQKHPSRAKEPATNLKIDPNNNSG